MKTADPDIHFFDLEVVPTGPQQGKVFAWASLRGEEWHQGQDVLALFEQMATSPYLCAHHFWGHDFNYLPKHLESGQSLAKDQHAIDTLYLSILLFPQATSHRLLKDYLLASNTPNNPQEDVRLLVELFFDCVAAWQNLSQSARAIFCYLLSAHPAYAGFFHWLGEAPPPWTAEHCVQEIKTVLAEQSCLNQIEWPTLLEKEPLSLALTLSLLLTKTPRFSPSPWILQTYPQVYTLLSAFRGQPCQEPHCLYCHTHFDIHQALQQYFGFNQFRVYEGVHLQEEIIQATLAGESLLAILPTGGGKSLTFQLPALMQGEALGALTVVISPLQSLMKDQVDNLSQRFEIEGAVTLNGALTPVERKMALEAVESGQAALLYISPESLRSNTVWRLLKQRNIARFVIDEAHCFSTWGQDFRVDYLYLARFIQRLQKQKKRETQIPVSCFTATAKQAVQTDILAYFQQRLNLNLRCFESTAQRRNLRFQVFDTPSENKFQRLKLLLAEGPGPKIVYTSSTRNVESLAQKLKSEGLSALPFHGQMERVEKLENMQAFMNGGCEIMVATSAFGMGVDKENVSMVIHYEISDSLEDYIQEAGRAGRKADLEAACYVLFDENDLNFHFQLLNQQRLNQKEINQIWMALKKLRTPDFSRSTLEVARDAGWDLEQKNLETRVKTAIAALEEAALLERNQNDTLLLAGYFATCPVAVANTRIAESPLLASEQDKITAKRIFQYLLSRTAQQDNHHTLRFDWLCEHLGIESPDVHRILNALRQADLIRTQSLQTVTLSTGKTLKTSSRLRLELLHTLETALLNMFKHAESDSLPYSVGVSLKAINHQLKTEGFNSSLENLRQVIKFVWGKDWVSAKRKDRQQERYLLDFHQPWPRWAEETKQRQSLEERVLNFLETLPTQANHPGKRTVAFRLEELQKSLNNQLFDTCSLNLHEIELMLLRLHRVQVLELEDGAALVYTRMRIKRLEENTRKSFTQAHYQALKAFYEHKIQQIHMVGEYARKMLANQVDALVFVEDYFRLNYPEFLKKYFPHREQVQELSQPLTQTRFKQIFGELSPEQLAIIKDHEHAQILVAAGPGSGKTRLLVHKVAALLLLEEVKPEQFLMLTYSRPAAQEMRQRLLKLIGNMAWRLDISTFHAYAFQLMERSGDKAVLENIIEEATAAIVARELPNQARLEEKSIVLVDEYQDISLREYQFLKAILNLASEAGEPRVIVVGDDDQNIYEFRGSSTRFMREFAADFASQSYYLHTNYRSDQQLVAFTNTFVQDLKDRIKAEIELVSARTEPGSLNLVQYNRPQFFIPFVEHLKTAPSQASRAVLCATNEEALLLTTLLNQQGIPAQQLLDLDSFKIKDLLELQLFHYYLKEQVESLQGQITPEYWEQAHAKVQRLCLGSKSLPLLAQLLQNYQNGHERLFMHEWEDWLDEMRWEDIRPSGQAGQVIVSTMHKAKGKEFDQVYLYLDQFKYQTQADLRVLYVAMTRARHRLEIHTRHPHLNGVAGLVAQHYALPFESPGELLVQLGLSDIQLGFAKKMQSPLRKSVAGRPLQLLQTGGFKDPLSGAVIQVSQKQAQKWQKLRQRGYVPGEAEIGFVVRWFDAQEQKAYRIALPQLRWIKEKESET